MWREEQKASQSVYDREHERLRAEMMRAVQSFSSTLYKDQKGEALHYLSQIHILPEKMLEKRTVHVAFMEENRKKHDEECVRYYSKKIDPLFNRLIKISDRIMTLSQALKQIKEDEAILAVEWAKQRQEDQRSSLPLFGGERKPKAEEKSKAIEQKNPRAKPKPVQDEKPKGLHKALIDALGKHRTLNKEIELLINKIKNNNDDNLFSKYYYLLIACDFLSEPLVRAFLNKGADPNKGFFTDVVIDTEGLTIGMTPLMLLAIKEEPQNDDKMIKCAKALLEYKADVNAVDSNGDTALHLAVRTDNEMMINLLLSHRDINPVRINNMGLDPLEEYENQDEHNPKIEQLLFKAQQRFLGEPVSGMLPIDRYFPPISSASPARQGMIWNPKLLLNDEKRIRAEFKKLNAFKAAQVGDLQNVDKSLDENERNLESFEEEYKSRTIYYKKQMLDLIKVIPSDFKKIEETLKAWSEEEKNYGLQKHYVSANEQLQQLRNERLLLEQRGIEIENLNVEMNHLFFSAIKNKRTNIVKSMLEQKIDPDLKMDVDQYKQITPLIACTIWTDDESIMRLLLQYGAHINMPDKYGFTALHTSAHFYSSKQCFFLLQQGADPTIKNKLEQTPRDVLEKEYTSRRVLKLKSHQSFRNAFVEKEKITAGLKR
jgi:ankyrin repeat protein